jgi:hypothetical protein
MQAMQEQLVVAPSDVQTNSKNTSSIKKPTVKVGFFMDGAPGEIRTPDRSVRSRVLYPAELQALNLKAGFYGLLCEFASLFCTLSAIFTFDVRADIAEDFVGYGL